MTVKDVKRWLRKIGNIEREISGILKRLEGLKAKYRYPSAIQYSDMPKAHTNRDLSDYVAKLDEYEKLLHDCLEERLKYAIEYTMACDKLPYEEAHVIMRKYIDGASWIQIANEIPCSERTVYYIHGRALKHLVNVCSSLQIIL